MKDAMVEVVLVRRVAMLDLEEFSYNLSEGYEFLEGGSSLVIQEVGLRG
jgi:hypothetical protein